MTYAILGAGNVGKALAKAFARKGMQVALASRRSPEELKPTAQAIGPNVIPLHMEDDLVVDVPPLQFVSPVGVSEGEEAEVDDNETVEEFGEDEDEYAEEFEDE